MSKERRRLRFLITSALLVGPAAGCGSAEPETITAPVELPTGNPVGPERERVPSVGTQPEGPPVGNEHSEYKGPVCAASNAT
jgi:hypothetical protein